MPGFENKIWGMKYDEPYSKTCYKEICVFGGCTDVPYPCFGTKLKEYEIFIGFNYPSVSPSQEATIYGCAQIATNVAYSIISAAVASCVVFNVACIAVVSESIPIANKVGRETFRECLVQAGLPEEIISKSEIGVYDRKHDA